MTSHIHKEQWQVVRDLVEQKPIGVNFIVGSATTFQNKNPSFNVLKMDSETLLPIDFETHNFELVHANKYDDPKWTLKFNYRDFFNLTDLSPQSFHKQAEHMYFDSDASAAYRDFRWVGGPSTWNPGPCDYKCRLEYYCQVVSGDYDEYMYCARDDKSQLFSEFVLQFLMDKLVPNWYEPTKAE